MPWTEDDVERHNKGLSAREKRQWCHVANGALEDGDDDGTAITKANGVVKKGRIESRTEALLNQKAKAMIESIRMQVIADIFEGVGQPENVLNTHGWNQSGEKADRKIYTHPDKSGHEIHVDAHGGWRHYDGDKCLQAGFTGEKMQKHLKESVLNEADPKPRVEKDYNGKPVIPNRQQFLMYFQDMQAGHIKQSVMDAHSRWLGAEQAALAARQAALGNKSKAAKEHADMAAAHLKALAAEISVGNMVMKQKQTKEVQGKKKENKKIKGRASTANKIVNTVTKGQSPLMKMLAKHAVKAFMPKPLDVTKQKNSFFKPQKPNLPKGNTP